MSEARPTDRSLPALAARAQLGERSALEELLRALQAPLLDHIRGLLRDDDLAADVLQDVLFIICRRLGTIRQTEWVRAWAYRVATREAFRADRRARRDHGESIDDASTIADTSIDDASLERDEQVAALSAKLADLPAAAQVVLRLRYQQGFTQQEIAAALEIPVGTVKSRLAYGLMCLRRS